MQRFLASGRYLSLPSLLAGILLGGTLTTFAATMLGSAQFSDVQPGSFYDAAVGRLVEQGIVQGYPDKTFRPGQLVNRAEVAVMIDRAINGTESQAAAPEPEEEEEEEVAKSSSSKSSSSSSSKASVAAVTVGEAGAIHFTTTGFNVAKGSKRATIAVIRTGGKKGDVKVDYSFEGGSAISGTDYSPSSGTMVFADGETTKNISVTLMRTEDSPQRTLEVKLSNTTNGAVLGTPSTATLTLLGSATGGATSAAATSAAPGAGSFSFSANTYAIDEAGGSIAITVTRTGGSTLESKVNYATGGGTATAGKEYNTTQGTLTFAVGETSKTFSVQVLDNATIDGNKTVNVTLSNPTNGSAIIAPNPSSITIVDTDSNELSATAIIQFSTSFYTVTEGVGTAYVTVLRQASFKDTVGVTYSTNDGTATAAADYTAANGTLSFGPGEASKSIAIPILKDSLVESEETVNLYLATPTGTAVIGTQATATLKIQ